MVAWLRDAVDVDFEALPIRDRPLYPPPPVGVALRMPGKRPKYLAWGHPNGKNNCSYGFARRTLGEIWDSGRPLLFHNAKFDVDTAEEEMGLPRLDWSRYHDTLPALFIMDPDAPDYALKSSSERILNLPPEEQDAVIEWLMDHQPVPGVKLTRSKKSAYYAGAYLAYAPAELVGKYACGDLTRTHGLARVVFPNLEQRGLTAAYDRERELMPHILEMERQGIRIDVTRIEEDIERYRVEAEKVDRWLRKKLCVGESTNLDSSTQLAEALINAKYCTEEDLGYTRTGKVQSNKDALTNAVKDRRILAVLKYRTQLSTCLGIFMEPWCKTAKESGGLVYTSWNSTRTQRHGDSAGARTGRLSSSRIQNMPKRFAPLFKQWAADDPELRSQDIAKLPSTPYKGMLRLPLVRSYVIPYEKGHVIIGRDYSQQELRGLAHFTGGVMLDAYQKDPWLDFHDMAMTLINDTLRENYKRGAVKTTGFGLVYGMGVGKLAERNGTDLATAKKLKAAYLQMFPGIKELYSEAKSRAKSNRPIRTWGGREYFCEPARFHPVKKRWMEFDYKLPNRLIQGSSADITKVAMLEYCKRKPKEHRLILTVHDELMASVPKKDLHKGMKLLKECMEDPIDMDVPMLSEGKWSDTNWGDLKVYDKKGKRV